MKSRAIPSLVALASVPLILVSLAACSSDDFASSATKGAAKTVTSHDWGVAHAECMRAAGHEVEDPTADGNGQGISLGDGDTIEKFTADNETCNTEVTKKLGERPLTDEQKKLNDENSKTDDCLRKEGVEVDDGKALVLDDVPKAVQEKCGIAAGDGDSGRAH